MTKTRERTIEERWKVVTLWQEFGNKALVSRRLKIPRTTVSDIISLWLRTGDVTPRARSGRPPKIDQGVAERIDQWVDEDPWIVSAEVCDKLLAMGIEVSARSIRRYWTENDFVTTNGLKCPMLTAHQKAQRLSYCKSLSKKLMYATFWSDEKPFTFGRIRRKMRHRRGEQPARSPTVKYPPKVQFWGGVSVDHGITYGYMWRGERHNSEDYQQVLQDCLLTVLKDLPRGSWFFQQDRDTTHTSHSTARWLNRNLGEKGKWWNSPGNSPDLNPIEYVWNTLEQRVCARRPSTVAELEQYIDEEWAGVTADDIKSAVDHVWKLSRLVIDHGGDFVPDFVYRRAARNN